MPKILNISDYSIGYDQGYQDGIDEGFADGYDTAAKEYDGRITALNGELQTLIARISVLERKL
jgi:flagellar biosynthesis/type III secretory pathway protein FliH